MKSVKILASLLFVMMVCTAATLEEKQKGIYIVGVSASFTDPHVYFTSVQFIDSVKVGKDKLLPLRAEYSDQLDDYLEQQKGMKNRTTFIYFDKKKGALEKTIKKMKEKYLKKGDVSIQQVEEGFKFTRVVDYSN